MHRFLLQQLCLLILMVFMPLRCNANAFDPKSYDLNEHMCFTDKSSCEPFCEKLQANLTAESGEELPVLCQQFKTCNGTDTRPWSCQVDLGWINRIIGTIGAGVLVVLVVCVCCCCGCCCGLIYCCMKKSSPGTAAQGGAMATVQYNANDQYPKQPPPYSNPQQNA